LAAQTLLKQGYRKIGFLGGPSDSTSTQDRLQGFKDFLALNKLSVDVNFAQSYSYDAGYKAMRSRIDQGSLPDALFCGDDVIAVGAMDAVAEAGLKIPDDIGIIGFNDMEMSGWRCIDLTTIRQPVQNIIAASVDLIISLIHSPDSTPETRLLPCEVVQRSTLRRLAAEVAHDDRQTALGPNDPERGDGAGRKRIRAQVNRSGQSSD
jgi:DNA-binding LacI/PurR family transcriptional regulator